MQSPDVSRPTSACASQVTSALARVLLGDVGRVTPPRVTGWGRGSTPPALKLTWHLPFVCGESEGRDSGTQRPRPPGVQAAHSQPAACTRRPASPSTLRFSKTVRVLQEKTLLSRAPCGSEAAPVPAGWAEAAQVSPQRLVAFPAAPAGQHTPSRPARASSGPHTSRAWAPGPNALGWFLCSEAQPASEQARLLLVLLAGPPHTPPTPALLLKCKCPCDPPNYSLLCPTCGVTSYGDTRSSGLQGLGSDSRPGRT